MSHQYPLIRLSPDGSLLSYPGWDSTIYELVSWGLDWTAIDSEYSLAEAFIPTLSSRLGVPPIFASLS